MKKSLFGYNVAEVDAKIAALEKEIEELKTTVATSDSAYKSMQESAIEAMKSNRDLQKKAADAAAKADREKATLEAKIAVLTKDGEAALEAAKAEIDELQKKVTILDVKLQRAAIMGTK